MMQRLAYGFTVTTLFFAMVSSTLAQRSPSAAIKYRDRSRVREEARASIVSHTFRGLQFKVGARQKTISNDDVIEITYRNPPDGYDVAVNAHRNGRWLEAVDALTAMLDDASGMKRRPWAAEEGWYRLWDSYRVLRRNPEMKDARSKLVKLARESRFLPKIELSEAQSLFAKGDFAAAGKAFAKLGSTAKSKDYAKSYALEALAGEARALLEQKNIDKARGLISTLEKDANAAGDKKLVATAKILSGHVMYRSGKTQEAHDYFEKLLNGVTDAENYRLIAGAANGKGDCSFALGRFRTGAVRLFDRARNLPRRDRIRRRRRLGPLDVGELLQASRERRKAG